MINFERIFENFQNNFQTIDKKLNNLENIVKKISIDTDNIILISNINQIKISDGFRDAINHDFKKIQDECLLMSKSNNEEYLEKLLINLLTIANSSFDLKSILKFYTIEDLEKEFISNSNSSIPSEEVLECLRLFSIKMELLIQMNSKIFLYSSFF